MNNEVYNQVYFETKQSVLYRFRTVNIKTIDIARKVNILMPRSF